MTIDRHTRDLTILNTVAQALNQSVGLDAALQAALSHTAELLDLHAGWIWLLSEETGEHYLAAAQNLPPALAHDPHKMEGWCHCVEQYLEGELDRPANIDVITCSRLKGLLAGTDGLRYHASIPLHAHDKQIGILNVASADWCELSADDLRLLYTIGDMLGIAVERARLFARSAQLGAVSERNRLAREIHDTLAQGFSAIALHLETADALLEAGATRDKVRHAVAQALALAHNNLAETRRSVLDLRAVPLEGLTLAAALTRLADQAMARHGLRVEFVAVGGSRPLPAALEIGFYRIAEEALANIAQHAATESAHITLTTSPESALLSIEDSGRGFDPEHVTPFRYGLVGMNERANLLGGALTIASTPGAGTRVVVRAPLARNDHGTNR